MEIHNKRELRNIVAYHSADIDYKDFMNIYRKCINRPYSFLITDTMFPANNPLKFRKKIFQIHYKMTLTDELQILDDKMKANQAQCDLNREAAKTSALSSKELGKY